MPEQHPLSVVAASYDSVDAAIVDYEALKALYRVPGAAHGFDAAVVARDQHGQVRIVRKHEHPTRHGAAVGVGWGLAPGVAALLFPPLGVIAVRAAGAVGSAEVVAVAGHAAGGLDREALSRLGEALDAGRAGVVVVCETRLTGRVEAGVATAGRVVTAAIDVDTDRLAADLLKTQEPVLPVPPRQTGPPELS
ncbi:hypothetical protein [Oryzihumus sp.]|uniref:hypothetical protein n=1 Tax=Oryzihumus sp. TaxID=1968903 RepID=UPI002EDA2003